jgi:hypothetical protein
MAQVVECLLSNCEALNSNPKLPKKREKEKQGTFLVCKVIV